jgi:hypothetical protein
MSRASRSRVVGNLESTILGSGMQRPHVHIDQEGHRIEREQRLRVAAKNERVGSGENLEPDWTSSRIPGAVRLKCDAEFCGETRLRERQCVATLAKGQ